MHDKPHILFVDAHTKSNGCDNNLNFVCHPVFLDFCSLVIVEVGVVEVAFDAVVSFEDHRQLFTFFAGNAIYDTTLPSKPILHQISQILILITFDSTNFVDQIWAIVA